MKEKIMKYSEFINESFVNESNESAMASDAIKAIMFKIQKPLEAALKKFEKIGVYKSLTKFKVQPFNGGWEMQFGGKEDHKRIWEINDMIEQDLFNNLARINNLYSVSIYPASWFEENFEDGRGGTSSFTVTNLNILADIKTQSVVVNGRSDIKPKLKVIEDQLLKQVKYISDEIDKIEKIVSNEPTNESLDEEFSYVTRGNNEVAIKLGKFIMKNNGPVGWSQMAELLKDMAAKLEEGKDINALTYFTK